MATLYFVKKARKDIPDTDIKIGDSYYWWKFRTTGRHISKTKPSRSQLTQSEFYASLWNIEDSIIASTPDDSFEDIISSAIEELIQLADNCEDKRSNMPESLQDSDTGQLLEERAQSCRDLADELSRIDLDIDPGLSDEEKKEEWQSKLDEAQDLS